MVVAVASAISLAFRAASAVELGDGVGVVSEVGVESAVRIGPAPEPPLPLLGTVARCVEAGTAVTTGRGLGGGVGLGIGVGSGRLKGDVVGGDTTPFGPPLLKAQS